MMAERVATPLPLDDDGHIDPSEPLRSYQLFKNKCVQLQEVDEGQPCLACGDKCPGFVTHQWRSVCRNCRCPREVHDVYHEDFVSVRNRLGWEIPSDPNLYVGREQTLQEGYVWVPAGLSSSKIEDYMEQLDNHKIPRIGSTGEKYRTLQLITQLPKQDLGQEHCRHLSTAPEIKSFKDFRFTRDTQVMDIARVQEYVKEEKVCASCEGEITSGEMAVVIDKVEDTYWHPACFICTTCQELLVDLVYCYAADAIYCERHYAQLIRPRCSACDEVSGEKRREADIAACHRGHVRRSSIPHAWSETKVESQPTPTHIPKRIHTPEEELLHSPAYLQCIYDLIRPREKEVIEEEIVPETQSHVQTGVLRGRPPPPPPPGPRPPSIPGEEAMQGYSYDFSQEKRHSITTPPPLIFSGEYTKAMDQDWHSGHFCCWNCDLSLTGHRYILRDEHPFCIKCYENLFANACEECKQPIGTDSKDLSYKDKHWHESCFKCIDCQKSLVDQPFASKEEKLYCADCHDNNFAARCDGCANIFRAGMKKFEFRGKQWHEECFTCSVCKQPIGNKRFIPRDQEFVCVPCYEEQFAQRCSKCNGVINKGGITYKAKPFHRDCFTCMNCNKVLAGEKFTSREEQPFCADCFGELFAKKCCRCTKPITGLGGTKFISFDDRHWHSDCFGCYRCSASLVGRGFLTNGDDILCPECGKNI